MIQGEVTGSLDVEHVEIKSNGYVKGSVTSNDFIIEPGGIFEGESIRKTSSKIKNNIEKKEDTQEKVS